MKRIAREIAAHFFGKRSFIPVQRHDSNVQAIRRGGARIPAT
jgi:uncharacterized membrane protein